MRYRHYRHECNYRVEMRLPTGRIPAWIVNISASGARMEGLGEQRPQTPVAMVLNGFVHAGRIVWCRAGLCGIRFDQELSRTAVERVRERQAGPIQSRRMQSAGHHGFREL